MAERIWKSLKEKYQKAYQDNPVHLPSGAANPDKYDWSLLTEMSFIKEYVNNRPVISSLRTGPSKAISDIDTPSQSHLEAIQVEMARYRESGSIVKKSSLKEKVAAYEVALPPVIPKLDATGLRNKAAKGKILSITENIFKQIEVVTKAVNANQDMDNDKQKLFTDVFNEELKYISKARHAEVYLEVCKELKDFK